MQAVLDAFPRRPMQLRPPIGSWRGALWMLLGLVMLGGFAFYLGFSLLPDLRHDFALEGSAQPTRTARLLRGSCSSRLGVMHDCTLHMQVDSKEGPRERELHYLFFDFNLSGSYTVQSVLSDPNRPDSLTTDLGMNRLWNRAITLAGMAAVAVLLVFGAFAYVRSSGRQRRAVQWLSGQTLSPVPLRFAGWQGRDAWLVEEANGRRHAWTVPGRSKPFLIDMQRNLILGVTAPKADAPFPLDEKLRWAKLTEAERVALLAARGT